MKFRCVAQYEHGNASAFAHFDGLGPLHMGISGAHENFGAGSGTGNCCKITTMKCSLC